MFSSVWSAAICGVECVPVRVEADVSNGLPMFTMVGYLNSQVKEAQERVRIAVRNAGISLPPKRITVNLSPADVRKEGNRFDLPIAAALLAAFGFIEKERLESVMMAGELSLDGKVNPVRGVLPLAEAAYGNGCGLCVVPEGNYREAVMAGKCRVLGVRSLQEFIERAALDDWGLSGEDGGEERRDNAVVSSLESQDVDFSDIRGQEGVKRAALIAAAGFHNFLMSGMKGAGKTMIARRIPTIMPELTREECMEISRLYSIAGLLSEQKPYLTQRPFRAPHHTASPQAMAGGGRFPRPGEITLSHRGVLFLDEFPEFSHMAVEILRQPLEEHRILIARTGGVFEFPAHFMLVAAMNHCPCGNYPDLARCTCTAAEINRYQSRISGPILDRIDMCVETQNVTYGDLTGGKMGKTSAEYKKEVEKACNIQQARYERTGIRFNSELGMEEIRHFCHTSPEGRRILEKAFEKMNLSARGYHKILKTARTIADLDQEEEIKEAHISEAICYRSVEEVR